MKAEAFWSVTNGGPGAFNANNSSSTPYLSVTKEYFFAPQYENSAFLHEEYIVNGHSIKHIAQAIASSRDAVANGLRKAGIAVRNAHHAHGNLSQPAFGINIRGGKPVVNKAEAIVIEQIKAMSVSGLSLRQIAHTLDQMKVPTKNRGKAWHPNMVKRVLERCK